MNLTVDFPRRRLFHALGAGASIVAMPTVAGSGVPSLIQSSQGIRVDVFRLGVASGEPHPSGFTLWCRLFAEDAAHALPPEVSVHWEVAADEAFREIIQRGEHLAVSAWDHSVHVDVTDLQASRHYWYRFSALGQQSMTGRTRTAPIISALEPLHFVTASCQRWDHGHYAAWDHISRESPDLVLFLGDYIYEYGSVAGRIRSHEGGLVSSLAQYRARYAQYKSDPALQSAHACAPWMVIWDDHEVDNDYASLQGERLQPDFASQRAAAYQAYWENMPLPNTMRPSFERTGGALTLYRRREWGRLARLHFLDDRQYRDVQVCPRPGKGGSTVVKRAACPTIDEDGRSLLGREQEKWLSEGWDLDRPWNLLAQQTLMARLAWTDPSAVDQGSYWTDGWDGYPAARGRLFDGIVQRQVPGVVVFGGDVHAHYVADLKASFDDHRSATVATEFCGTSISSFGLNNATLQKARIFNPHLKYARSDQRGYMSFTLNAQALEARVMALDDPNARDSGVQVVARYAVNPREPGANPT
jgi:alkaline phosphatase D